MTGSDRARRDSVEAEVQKSVTCAERKVSAKKGIPHKEGTPASREGKVGRHRREKKREREDNTMPGHNAPLFGTDPRARPPSWQY